MIKISALAALALALLAHASPVQRRQASSTLAPSATATFRDGPVFSAINTVTPVTGTANSVTPTDPSVTYSPALTPDCIKTDSSSFCTNGTPWSQRPGPNGSTTAIMTSCNGFSSAQLKFNGTGIDWISTLDPIGTFVNVLLDGNLVAVIGSGSTGSSPQGTTTVYSSGTIPAGEHSLSLVTGVPYNLVANLASGSTPSASNLSCMDVVSFTVYSAGSVTGPNAGNSA